LLPKGMEGFPDDVAVALALAARFRGVAGLAKGKNLVELRSRPKP
jgi:hypothetical protein